MLSFLFANVKISDIFPPAGEGKTEKKNNISKICEYVICK